MKPGDFSGLASSYSRSRPGYSRVVLNAIFSVFDRPVSKLDVVDVGAGTGIWTRMLSSLGPASCTGVEPNRAMLKQAELDSDEFEIRWINSAAENIPVPDESFDYLSMASSFHWVDFDRAIEEFRRVIKPKGAFSVLWNPRLTDNHPKFVEIENWLNLRLPMKRVSSGLSGITVGLTQKLEKISFVQKVVYIEAKESRVISPEIYLDAWRSVNDVQSQLGAEKFEEFLNFVDSVVGNETELIVTNTTRSWTAMLD